MNTMFRKCCSIVVGLVYVASGLLKVMDPVGTGLIVEAYFRFMHLPESALVAKILGVVLGALETAVGFAAVFCVLSRITRWIMLGMQSSFTILSLALVIWNPQMHCGCFGEAIHLTHGQTFIKNIVLMGMLWLAYFPILEATMTKIWQYIAFASSVILMAGFAGYSWYYIPVIDFTDYKKGTRIISHHDYWKLSDEEKKGKVTIPMLGIHNSEEIEDLTSGKWVIISMHDIPDDINSWLRIKDKFVRLGFKGHSVILLVASTKDRIWDSYVRLYDETDIAHDILDKMLNSTFLTLKTTVQTLNRCNGGITLLEDGVILEKTVRVY